MPPLYDTTTLQSTANLQGEFVEFQTFFPFLLPMNELQLHTILEQAERYYEDGKPLHSIQLLKQIINKNPACDKAYVYLAQIFVEMNRGDQAEKVLLQGAETNKENLEYNVLLGNLHLRQHQFDRALEYFGSLQHLNIPQIHENIGLIYFYKGDFEAAETELRRAAIADPTLPKVHELLGEVLMRRRSFVDAIEVLRVALRYDPYSNSAHKLLGAAYLTDNRTEKAYNEFVTAIDCDPDDFESWFSCGDVLVRLTRFNEAKPYLERACAINPKSANALVSLGIVRLKLGENDEACKAFDAALAMEPEHHEAQQLKLQLKTN